MMLFAAAAVVGMTPLATLAATPVSYTNYHPYIAGSAIATAWYGDRVAVIIEGETSAMAQARDKAAMDKLVRGLDNIVAAYNDVFGYEPSHAADLNGHVRVEVPKDIGGGLGGHGTFGFAVDDAFLNLVYNDIKSHPTQPNYAFQQVYFYELSRNYWIPKLNNSIDYATSDGPSQWGWWTVGFNNAMAALMPLSNIEGVSDMFYFGNGGAYFRNGMLSYYNTYVSDPQWTWDNSWNVNMLPFVANTSLNDLMSGTIIHMYDTYGGPRVLEGLYREMLRVAPDTHITDDPQGARDRFYLAASRASDIDLRDYFTNELKWTLSASAHPFTDFTWTGAGSQWGQAANWSSADSSGAPGAEFDRAIFTGNMIAAVDLGGNRTLRSIHFDPAATGAFTISNSVPGASLTLGDGGYITKEANPTIKNQTVSTPITLAGDAVFMNNNDWIQQANKLIISGPITGGDRLRIEGSPTGAVELSGDNSAMTANIVVGSGMLLVGSDHALGDTVGNTTMNGGLLWLAGGVNTPENFVIADNTTQSSLNASAMSGNVKVNSGKTFTITNGGGNHLAMSGAISGEGNLAFTYANTVLSGTTSNTLSGTMSLSANSTVNPAYNQLRLNKSDGAIAVAGPLVVSNRGTVILDASNQIADTSLVTLNGPNAILRMNGQADAIGGLQGGGNGAGVVENESGVANIGTIEVNIPMGMTRTYAGVLRDGDGAGVDGVLAFTKSGDGRQALSGVNSYSGVTDVRSGVLAIEGNGSINSTTAVTINGGTFIQNSSLPMSQPVIINSGIIGGNGSYSGAVAVGAGHISPGDGGAGTVTFIGGLGLEAASVLDFDLASSADVNDLIQISNGALTLDGTLNIASSGPLNGVYTLFSGFSGLTNHGLALGNVPSGYAYGLSFDASHVYLTVQVPEPACLGLLGMAAFLLVPARTRRHV